MVLSQINKIQYKLTIPFDSSLKIHICTFLGQKIAEEIENPLLIITSARQNPLPVHIPQPSHHLRPHHPQILRIPQNPK